MSSSHKVDLESAAWLLEKLASASGHAFDRLHIRRAIDESSKSLPADEAENWWKWVSEASKSLGLKCKVIDGTFDQIMEMVRDDARIIFRRGSEPHWMAIAGTQGRKNLVIRPSKGQQQGRESARQLRRSLSVETRDEVIRCIVFEPQLTGTMESHSPIEGRTPIGRLSSLLAPERGDIAVIVVFALVTGLLALATPLAVETLVNTVAFGRVLQPVIILALMLLAFLSFSAALRGMQTVVVEIIQRRLFARFAADLSYRLPRVEYAALDGQSGRELTNRFFDIVTVQKVTAQLLLDGIGLILGTLIGMSVLAFYHPWLLGFDVVLLALIAFIIFVLGRGAIKTSIKESKTKYQMAAWLENIVSCPAAFRHGGAADFAIERSDRFIHDYLSARKTHFRILMRQIIFSLALQAIASTVLLGLGGWLVMTGQLTLGQLVAAELIVTVIVGSFAKLGKHVESFYDLLASVDKIGALLDLPMEPQEGLVKFPDENPAKVQLHHLGYKKHSGSGAVTGLDYVIAPGDRVVVLGRGGSGKSQLLDLLFGTRTPSSGYLTINDIDPSDLRPDALRQHVSLVRNIEIFDGTIAENIHLERPHVSTLDVREALLKVGALERILSLPDGLDTKLVETGDPLSSTLIQKLMIARSIAGSPRLLLVDKILDSLPDDDFELVTKALFAPDAPWTLVLVTGRECLIEQSTKTLRLDEAGASTEQKVVEND